VSYTQAGVYVYVCVCVCFTDLKEYKVYI
jgi:hypothetical protein